MTRLLSAFAIAQLLVSSAWGFSASSMKQQQKSRNAMPLQASLSVMDEEDAAYLMAKARECAFSDSCSVEESKEHLHDVLHIQEACASGTVFGQDLCENTQAAAEIVAQLRHNIEAGRHGLRTKDQSMVSAAAVPIAFLALTTASIILASNSSPDATPFTLQEVVWAARGGYLDDLVHHYMQNGGL